MHEVFISYAHNDAAWVDEELVPALTELGLSFFLDVAEWRKRVETRFDAEGLSPGGDLQQKLESGIREADAVVLVQTVAYFASKWCRRELEFAEKLALDAAGVPGRKLLYFVLAREDGRLDLSDNAERQLYVDLTEVRERAERLAFGLQYLSEKAKTLKLKLGDRSLQDLLDQKKVKAEMEALRSRHREFREAHNKMQAFKEAHDAIQRAQDSWQTLARARDEITAGKSASTRMMAADLADKCGQIKASFNAPALLNEWGVWFGTLEMGMTQLDAVLADGRNLDALNQALEVTRGILFLSPLAAELNTRIRIASKDLPIKSLREALAPLRELVKYPWHPSALDRLSKLMTEFDSLETRLQDIAGLVEVHDVLQNIDSIFSMAGHVEAKLINIEAIWPGIEMQRKKLPGMPWLKYFGMAADSMDEYLHRTPKPEAPPREEIEFFKAQLNQSFTRADFDLRTETGRLEDWHNGIDALFGQLAGRG